MLTINLEVREFLDGDPVAGAEVEAILFVVPLFAEVIPAGPPPAPRKPKKVIAPDFGQNRSRSVAGTVNASGLLTLRIDLDDLFADRKQATRNGDTAEDAVALMDLRVRDSSYDKTFRFRNERHAADARIDKKIAIDFAKCVVGNAEPDVVKLWFCLHGAIDQGDQCLLAVRTKRDNNIVFIRNTTFEERAATATVTVRPLRPSQVYQFELRYVRRGQNFDSARVIARGQFTTPTPDARRTRIAFGSCHLPTRIPGQPEDAVLDRWIDIRNLVSVEFDRLLLLGDQIYGDGIHRLSLGMSWFDRYIARYHQLWSFAPMRDVLRTIPTCMMLDDHDVVDDFGVIPPSEFRTGGDERINAALDAYRLFQQVHNPSGSKPPPFHDTFVHGNAACFMADVRTQRRPDARGEAHPILGDRQFADLQNWARGDAVRDADIIVFANPVPIAWIPVETLKRAAKALAEKGGVALGTLIGAAAGGPLGAFVAGAIGGEVLEDIVEEIVDAQKNDPDLEDQWTFGTNQRELVAVLDLLFDLANGIDPVSGASTGRKRAVFLLAGDAHLGGLHVIRSTRPRHAANPILFSATASPIARIPEDSELYVEFIRSVRDELGLGLSDALGAVEIDLNRRDLVRFDLDRKPLAAKLKQQDSGTFVLDSEGDKAFIAETLEIIGQRNYGLLRLERVPRTRAYRMQLEVRGSTHQPAIRFDFDLDAQTFSLEPFGSIKGKGLAPGGSIFGDNSTARPTGGAI